MEPNTSWHHIAPLTPKNTLSESTQNHIDSHLRIYIRINYKYTVYIHIPIVITALYIYIYTGIYITHYTVLYSYIYYYNYYTFQSIHLHVAIHSFTPRNHGLVGLQARYGPTSWARNTSSKRPTETGTGTQNSKWLLSYWLEYIIYQCIYIYIYIYIRQHV